MDAHKTYHFTLTIGADGLSSNPAPTVTQTDCCGEGTITKTDHGKDSTTERAGEDDVFPTKSCAERQAEHAATLHKNGKLIETVVEIAWNMALSHFRPNDSYEFHNLAKEWAAEFEVLFDDRVVLFDDRVALCEWREDVWREQCDRFTQEKLEEVVVAGLGWIVN